MSGPPNLKDEESPEDFLKKLDTYGSTEVSNKTLQEHIYQLRLLTLYAYRGWKNGHTFSLATEMNDAGIFDDVVIWYVDTEGHLCLRCLEAKHMLRYEDNEISYSDLVNNGFSLEKYFNSYRRIKETLVKNGESRKLKTCTICTNVPLAVKNGRINNTRIFIKEAEDADEFLEMKESAKSTRKRYKLRGADRNPGIYQRLISLSDCRVLAKELAQSVCTEGNSILCEDKFQYYHRALGAEVIDLKNLKFRDDFETCNDPTTDKGKFRKFFLEECWKIIDTRTKIWTVLNNNLKTLRFFPGFGVEYEAIEEEITDVGKFSVEFIKLIRDSGQDSDQIFVDIEEGRGTIIGQNFNKLYGQVLEVRDKKIKFKHDFLDGSGRMTSDMKEFRRYLSEGLKDEFNDLEKFYICVRRPDDCWQRFFSSSKLPDSSDIITDEDIDDFFNKFVFAAGQPGEDEIGRLVTKEIGEDKKLNNREAAFVGNSFQAMMLDWFKNPGKQPGKEGRFLTDKDVQRFFESVLKEKQNYDGRGPAYTLRTDSGKITELHEEQDEEWISGEDEEWLTEEDEEADEERDDEQDKEWISGEDEEWLTEEDEEADEEQDDEQDEDLDKEQEEKLDEAQEEEEVDEELDEEQDEKLDEEQDEDQEEELDEELDEESDEVLDDEEDEEQDEDQEEELDEEQDEEQDEDLDKEQEEKLDEAQEEEEVDEELDEEQDEKLDEEQDEDQEEELDEELDEESDEVLDDEEDEEQDEDQEEELDEEQDEEQDEDLDKEQEEKLDEAQEEEEVDEELDEEQDEKLDEEQDEDQEEELDEELDEESDEVLDDEEDEEQDEDQEEELDEEQDEEQDEDSDEK